MDPQEYNDDTRVDIKFQTDDIDDFTIEDRTIDQASEYVSRVLSSDWFDDTGLTITITEHDE